MLIYEAIDYFFITIFASGFGQENCKLQIKKDSITIYTCTIKNSKYKAVRTEFTLNATFSQVATMVLDIDRYHEWQYKAISAKILKKISDHEIIYYTEAAAPVITSNRDFVIHLTIDQNLKTNEMIIRAVSKPDYIPEKKNVVRVLFSEAIWRITPIGKQKLKVVYDIQIDLGGVVPPWMVNLVAPEAPYETFKKMREKISSFKSTPLSFVKD